MPSLLRQQTLFEPFSAETTRSRFISSPPQKKQKMSLTETYYIAASARSKLGREAGRPDHDLRLLVGHANLLDSLMLELADAERDQEAWFNQTVQKASKPEPSKHIQWADALPEEDEEMDDSDSDSDSDYEDIEYSIVNSLRRIPSPPVHITTTELEEEDDSEDEYEDEEDDEEHALARVPSAQGMPELIHDDVSDDESPPTSPPALTMEFSEETSQQQSFYDKPAAIPASETDAFTKDGFFIPSRRQPMIASF